MLIAVPQLLKCSCILEWHQKIAFSIFSRLIPDRKAETKIRVREGASKTDGGSEGKKIVEEREGDEVNSADF